jgi:MFS family permease
MGNNGSASGAHLALWRNRDYMLLWVGQGISSLGTGISQLALPLLILAISHSPAAAGFASALERVPYLLFSLPAGSLADRWSRKRVMIFCTLGLALCVLSIAAAFVSGHLTLLHIYLVSFVIGTLSTFYELTELAALAYMVPKEQLSAAVAQNEAVYSTNMLLAPSISGFLFKIAQSLPFVADTVSYVVLFVSLLFIRSPLQGKRDTATKHLLAEVREGIHWLWQQRFLRFLALLTGYGYVLMSGSVLIVLVIAQQHQISSAIVGIIFTIGGVGNVIGTLLTTPIERRYPMQRLLPILLLLFVLLWPLYGIVTAPLLLGLVAAGLALPDSIYSILVASYRFATVPDELQGRVGSVYRLIIYSMLTLGLALIGATLQRFGVLLTVAWLWGGLVVLTVLLLIHIRMLRSHSA